MRQNLNRVLIAILILLSLGAPMMSAIADTPPTPTTPVATAPVVLTFTQSSQSDAVRDELVFTVRQDGTTVLSIRQTQRDDSTANSLWQQPGRLNPDQLARVKALVSSLSDMIDQYIPDLAGIVTFEIPTKGSSSSATKTVRFAALFEHYEPENQAKFKDIIQTMRELRKASEPLIFFNRSGGFAARSADLYIMSDGTIWYRTLRQPAVKYTLPDRDRAQIAAGINDPVVQAYQPSGTTGCADCYIYNLNSVAADGNIKILTVDEAELQNAPQPVKALVGSLIALTKSSGSSATAAPTRQVPQSTPTAIAQPTSTCCTATIKDGQGSSWIGTLDRGEVLIGAARWLQLARNQAPTECVVLTMRGPMAYDITIFDGYWFQIERNATDTRINELVASATKTITDACGETRLQNIHIP